MRLSKIAPNDPQKDFWDSLIYNIFTLKTELNKEINKINHHKIPKSFNIYTVLGILPVFALCKR